MSNNWLFVPLGDVLTQRKQFIQIDDLTTYKRCRVQLHAQGIVLRDTAVGAEIKTKAQQVCHAGEFLVAEIDAKVGGFGIVPCDLEGAIVSSHYFLFRVDDAKLDRSFLDYFVRTRAFRDQVNAQGSTNYAAIRPSDVLSYVVPLPPLAEQRRIVVRIEALATRIEQARGLRREAIAETEMLSSQARTHALGESARIATRCTLGDVTTYHDAGISVQCQDRPALIGEWGILKTTAVQWFGYQANENKALPISYSPRPEFEVQQGDVLITRAGPIRTPNKTGG